MTHRILLAAVAASITLLVAGCASNTEPTDAVDEPEQVESSTSALSCERTTTFIAQFNYDGSDWFNRCKLGAAKPLPSEVNAWCNAQGYWEGTLGLRVSWNMTSTSCWSRNYVTCTRECND